MTKLCHAEAPRQVKAVKTRQELLMMLGRAQLADGPAAQREVDACLDGQRVIAQGQDLQASHEFAWICTDTARSEHKMRHDAEGRLLNLEV